MVVVADGSYGILNFLFIFFLGIGVLTNFDFFFFSDVEIFFF